ncbi:MAG: hypothetical protein U1E92_03285 [Moraxella osloensis]
MKIDLYQQKLPVVLDKMVNFHKAPSKGSMGGLNVLFGLSLLFFVVSSLFYSPQVQKFLSVAWRLCGSDYVGDFAAVINSPTNNLVG